ncbi:hypothetical protein PSHT_07487 [Puccinia striiformis]|uniref:GCM domain-containing protein n=1 Tax=Puccinia striiformis TaxID=27350 RepID=A0A2S4VXJ3_9BASI|nr:hypothetical protein PSHT_07487 [Puccinia striiformis]
MARAKKPKLPVLVPNPPLVNDKNAPPSTVHTHTTATKLKIPEVKAPLASSTKENWQLPVAMGQGFSTFIDHDTELDGQGYPLLPNRSTVYVRPVGAEIMNFDSVGFSNTNNVESRTKGQWKVIHVTCLGVMLCDWAECDYTGPPPTGRNKIKELLERNPGCPGTAGRCTGKIYHQHCSGTKCRFDIHESGWGLLRHKGFHDHPWPTPKKPDRLPLSEVAVEVKKNHKATALQLKIGNTGRADEPIKSVVDIHESLGNDDRLRYYRRQILNNVVDGPEKMNGGGDNFLHDMFQWLEKGLHIISDSWTKGEEHFTFQTDWMSQRLLKRSGEGNKLYSGGLISDVTYKFFQDGYLLTTSMYCEDVSRWIPVQLSWIRGLSDKYYEIHFTVLFRQFLIDSISATEREELATSIVDFSQAQTNGFVAAYCNVFGKISRQEAINKLRGCTEHFRQSITRGKGNHNAIRPDQEARFEGMCLALLERVDDAGRTHEERMDEVRRLFPKIKRWIDWWSMADVAHMLFPSCRPMPEDSPDGEDGLPKTTNAQESMHRVYYMFSEGKKSMLKGMVELYAFVKALERDYENVMRGMPIRYGAQLKKQINVSQSIGWVKPTKRQRAATKEFATEKNDGRPPDTTKSLLLGEYGRPTKQTKIGRPAKSANIDKNCYTTFVSYGSSNDPKLRNRCWLAAGLESLYTLYSPLWLKESDGKKTDLFNSVVSHFTLRTTYELTEKGSLKLILSRGSGIIFEAIQKLIPQMFQDGEYASCDFFIETVLDGPKKHLSKVLPSLFWNGISPSDAHQLVTLWASAGLHGVSGLQCRQCTVNSKKRGGRKAHPIKDINAKLDEVSIISPPESNPPLHLYFHLDLGTIFTHDDRHAFMAEMDWPFKLTVFGSVYTLVSRGFWAKDHYWGKVLCHVNGLMGVWMHDNQHNAGHARLVDTVPGSISGAQEHTSWLVYSRTWDAEEEQFVDESIARIRKDNPEFPSRIPFIHMKNLLNSSYHSNLPHGSSVLEPSVCDSKLPPIQEDLGPKDDAPYAEADPPAEAKCDVVKESSNCLQPPLKIRIRRPPTTVANIHPVSVPPPTRSNPLNAEVEPADLPALEAKRGRPKKRPEIKTTVSFKPDLELVLDSNTDRIQARHKATWHSHLPPPTPPPSQSVELKHGGASTEDKSKTKEEATLAPKKVATSGPKKAAPLGTKKAATAPKKKATTAAKKKGSTSAPKTPATLASTAPTTFEPAPLTDADYDRMAARGAAYWAEHWAKEHFKKATPEPSQITVAKEIAPPPGEPTNVKSTSRALGTRCSARTQRSDA